MLPEETAAQVRQKQPDAVLCAVDGEETFSVPPLEGSALFACPMLCETGCTMGTEKPFDCKIWPFRLMYDTGGRVRIAAAAYCPGMQPYTDAQLHDFLAEEGLASQLLAYGTDHPAHIKPYDKAYRMIW